MVTTTFDVELRKAAALCRQAQRRVLWSILGAGVGIALAFLVLSWLLKLPPTLAPLMDAVVFASLACLGYAAFCIGRERTASASFATLLRMYRNLTPDNQDALKIKNLPANQVLHMLATGDAAPGRSADKQPE